MVPRAFGVMRATSCFSSEKFGFRKKSDGFIFGHLPVAQHGFLHFSAILASITSYSFGFFFLL